MSNKDAFLRVKYFTNRLNEDALRMRAVYHRTLNIPAEPLTYEEQLGVRFVMEDALSHISLLTTRVAELEMELNKPLWKKILRK